MTPTLAPNVIDRRELRLNDVDRIAVSAIEIGGEHVVILDDVYANPEYVRAVALSLDYHIPRGHYPGKFALISIHPRELLALLNSIVPPYLGVEVECHTYCRDLTFAVISSPGSALSVTQRQPHYDDFSDIAAIVYLNPPQQCSGGTSFWRHRATGSTALPDLGDDEASRLAARCTANIWLAESAATAPGGYPTVSTADWELLNIVAMQFNRLVIYSGRLFHSPHYDESCFGNTNAERRLTQNLYLNARRIGGPSAERP